MKKNQLVQHITQLFKCFPWRQPLCAVKVFAHPISSNRILGLKVGEDLIKIIIFAASSKTFLSKTGFLFSLQAHGNER